MTMTARVKIAPVSKSIRVNATQAHAFEVFHFRAGALVAA